MEPIFGNEEERAKRAKQAEPKRDLSTPAERVKAYQEKARSVSTDRIMVVCHRLLMDLVQEHHMEKRWLKASRPQDFSGPKMTELKDYIQYHFNVILKQENLEDTLEAVARYMKNKMRETVMYALRTSD
jgi:ribonucleotide reductase beta subunit family protein with ferritin-like domain